MCCVCAVRFWSGTGRTSSECFRSRDLILYLDTERVSLYPAKRRCARSSMDRASDYGSEGWGFESLRARSGPPRCDPPAGALHFVKHPCGGAFSFPGVPFHGGMRRFQMKPESPRYWLPYGGLKPELPRRAEKPSIAGVVPEQGRCGFQTCVRAAVLARPSSAHAPTSSNLRARGHAGPVRVSPRRECARGEAGAHGARPGYRADRVGLAVSVRLVGVGKWFIGRRVLLEGWLLWLCGVGRFLGCARCGARGCRPARARGLLLDFSWV